jgi:hypothetical protein
MNMLNFYKRRYASNQSEMEKKFNAAVEDLIETGDISKKDYVAFCVTNDVEPTIDHKSSSSSSIDRVRTIIQTQSVDPCGRGGGRVSSGC